MRDVTRFFLLLLDNRKLLAWLFALALAIGLAVSFSIRPVYESQAMLKIGSNIQMGQISLARDLATLNERFRIFIDLPRDVERARNLSARLKQVHGGRTPFFGAPEKAYLADAQSLDTWDEMVLIKVRAGNPQDAVNMAEELLAEVLQTHNGHVESNREAVTRILELAKQESDQLEKTPDSPEKVLAQVLLEERIARLRQQLDEFIKNSEIVQAPGDVVLRLKPRPFLYTVVGLLVSLVSSVMLVVMTVWLRGLVRELREVSGKS